MQAVRDFLPERLRRNMEKALGKQETLRLMWPNIVGGRLASSVQLTQVRGGTLIVSVPDRVWQGSLQELEHLILDAVNRSGHNIHCNAVRFTVAAPSAAMAAGENQAAATPHARAGAGSIPTLPEPATGDSSTREIFARSAAKYFAREPERPE